MQPIVLKQIHSRRRGRLDSNEMDRDEKEKMK